jgi:hypothetical protein
MKSQTPDNEVAYSPLRISLILHCYSRADWIENEQAPAVQEELKSLVASGILEPQQPVPHYRLTPRGLDFVKTLLATPFPAPEETQDGATMSEWYGGFSKIESTEPKNEVSMLKEMVMDAARRGDMMAAHWKERAEKAEAIIQQLHHFAGIIEGFQTTATK